jgi:hypothetical protein
MHIIFPEGCFYKEITGPSIKGPVCAFFRYVAIRLNFLSRKKEEVGEAVC